MQIQYDDEINWTAMSEQIKARLQTIDRPTLKQILEEVCADAGAPSPVRRWEQERRAVDRSRRNNAKRRSRKHGGRR